MVADNIKQIHLFQELSIDELEDVSYTISYDCDTQEWISFHDWKPNGIFSTRTELYSLKNNSVYLHNSEEKSIFYGIEYKGYISPILVSPNKNSDIKQPFLLASIIVDSTLPYGSWIFNHKECTEEIQWIAYDTNKTLHENYNQANCRFVKSRWNFNNIRVASISSSFLVNKPDELNYLQSQIGNPNHIGSRVIDNSVVVKLIFDRVWKFNEIGFKINLML